MEFGGGDFRGSLNCAALAAESRESRGGGQMSAEDAANEGPGAFAVLPKLGGGALSAAHGEQMVDVSNRGGGEGPQDPRQREGLGDEKQAIALDEVGF